MPLLKVCRVASLCACHAWTLFFSRMPQCALSSHAGCLNTAVEAFTAAQSTQDIERLGKICLVTRDVEICLMTWCQHACVSVLGHTSMGQCGLLSLWISKANKSWSQEVLQIILWHMQEVVKTSRQFVSMVLLALKSGNWRKGTIFEKKRCHCRSSEKIGCSD